jgi:hypothetical protein
MVKRILAESPARMAESGPTCIAGKTADADWVSITRRITKRRPRSQWSSAAHDAASREQDKIERENLRRVGMLAR